jgi:hypothetical protein
LTKGKKKLGSNRNNTSKPVKVILHENFVCYYSPFFAAAFKGRFQEGITKTLTLQADNEAFGIFSN